MKNKKRSEWYKFYQDRMNPVYRKHIETRYADFLNCIGRHLPYKEFGEPVHLHEAGCGAANISTAMAKKLKEQGINSYISMSDKCPDMLELAHENYGDGYKAMIDMTKDRLPTADVIFSHGVLEHFSDEMICKIVANQLDSTDTVLHYVPGEKYKKPSFGDERLMTPEQWQQICNPTSIVEFNDGYDLILIWEKEKIAAPPFLIKKTTSGDKILYKTEQNTHRPFHHVYGDLSLCKYDTFILSKGQLSYPDSKYAWAQHYRYPTPNEELIYGRDQR